MKKKIAFIGAIALAVALFANGNNELGSEDLNLDNLISMNKADASCEPHWSNMMHCNSFGRCSYWGMVYRVHLDFKVGNGALDFIKF